MNFYSGERVAMFIDGTNFYIVARRIGLEIDYRKLLELFSSRCQLVRAFYYTPVPEGNEYSPIRPLVDWLDYNGYTVVTKPTHEYVDENGQSRKARSSMDVEIAVDMLEMAPRLNHVVLFSGSGDFRPLVAAVQRKGVRVTVISSLRSQPPMITDELRRQADTFIDVRDIAPYVSRTTSREPRHSPASGEGYYRSGERDRGMDTEEEEEDIDEEEDVDGEEDGADDEGEDTASRY